MSCPFYGYCQGTLMPGTGACPTTRFYLTSIGYIVAQFLRVSVIYYLILIGAKKANFTPWYVPSMAPPGTLWFTACSTSHWLLTPLEGNIIRLQFTGIAFFMFAFFRSAFFRSAFKRRVCSLPIKELHPIGYNFISSARLAILALPGAHT